MVHIGTTTVLDPVHELTPFGIETGSTGQPVLIVREDGADNYLIDTICEFLGLNTQHVSAADDITLMLHMIQPMAVIADLAAEPQDGYHIMKTTAAFDRTLPVLLLTGADPALLGAVDAVQEVWGLTRVATVTGHGDIVQFVDFLCQAARDAGAGRLMRA